MSAAPPVIAYFFTTFPKNTETFLQREIVAMRALGVNLRLYSIWGGGGTFRGLTVTPFNKWRLLTLFWLIPAESWRRPEVLWQLLRGLATRRATWLNFGENAQRRRLRPTARVPQKPAGVIHAGGGGAGHTACSCGGGRHRFSARGARLRHYEHGDWC